MGIDKWNLFDWAWRASDDDASITDASEANDDFVEQAIEDFQRISKQVTDMLVSLSSGSEGNYDLLQKFREAVTIAYTDALDGDLEGVKKELRRVVEL